MAHRAVVKLFGYNASFFHHLLADLLLVIRELELKVENFVQRTHVHFRMPVAIETENHLKRLRLVRITHLVDAPVAILYTEIAVIIGSLHVFFPMMVLPLASALGKIDPNLEDAARMLGAPWWKVFLRVTLPLSMPGFVAGFTLVFSLTAGSFVIPAILGGASAVMLGNLIEQQIFVVYDWPFGAAIALVLVGVVFAVNGFSMWLLEGRRLRRAT